MAANSRKYDRQYWEKNRERINHQGLEWYYRNREKQLEYGRRYYARTAEENRERNRIRAAEYRKAHPKKAREIRKRFYDAHAEQCREIARQQRIKKGPGCIAEDNRKYKAEHKDELREYSRRYQKKRRMQLPEVRLLGNLRTKIRLALNSAAMTKAEKTVDLLGCAPVELRIYLESRFKPGMSWENYGRKGWHVDHIRPCASFDLTDKVQRLECFHYTNLQPLWAIENWRKGAHYGD